MDEMLSPLSILDLYWFVLWGPIWGLEDDGVVTELLKQTLFIYYFDVW